MTERERLYKRLSPTITDAATEFAAQAVASGHQTCTGSKIGTQFGGRLYVEHAMLSVETLGKAIGDIIGEHETIRRITRLAILSPTHFGITHALVGWFPPECIPLPHRP